MTDDISSVRRLVWRNGAVLAIDHGDAIEPLEVESTLTRRGARRAFDAFRRRLLVHGTPGATGEYPPGAALYAVRIERGRMAEAASLPFPPVEPGEPDAGVREPRRPTPSTGHGTATADGEGSDPEV